METYLVAQGYKESDNKVYFSWSDVFEEDAGYSKIIAFNKEGNYLYTYIYDIDQGWEIGED